MDIQTLLAFALLAAGVGYLLYRYVFKKLAHKSAGKDCGPDCNCS